MWGRFGGITGLYSREREFVMGVDLGKVTDYSAITVVERIPESRGIDPYSKEMLFRLRNVVRQLERVRLGDVVSTGDGSGAGAGAGVVVRGPADGGGGWDGRGGAGAGCVAGIGSGRGVGRSDDHGRGEGGAGGEGVDGWCRRRRWWWDCREWWCVGSWRWRRICGCGRSWWRRWWGWGGACGRRVGGMMIW